MSMKACFSIILFLLSLSYSSESQQNWPVFHADTIALLPDKDLNTGSMQKIMDFLCGKEKIQVWGGGTQNSAVYPDELLPAFFIRTLLFKEIHLDGGMVEWIFTGDKGGITIKITGNEVWVTQRYYDSFGFNEADPGKNRLNAGRYPQKKIVELKTIFSGKLNNVSLESASSLLMKLRLNGQVVAELPCLYDLIRHQIKYTGNGFVSGVLLKPGSGPTVQIHVNPEKTHQEILGFGGILSPSAYWSLNERGKAKWWGIIKEYNLLLQREYPTSAMLKPDFTNWDDPDYIVPHYYGDNFPNGELTDFEYVKRIRELGGIDIFEFWSLPGFMNENGKVNIQKYAEAIVSYCKTSVAKTGKPPEIVGIQNEVTQTPETWRDMTLALRRELDANGFQGVKIHAHNSSRLNGGIKAMKSFQQYPGVWDKLDYAASNLYDYQHVIFSPDEFDKSIAEFNSLVGDKPFISTEICVNAVNLQTDAYKLAFSYAMLYHKNMAMMNAIAIMYCWTLLDYTQPSFAPTRTLFTLDHKNDMLPVASGFQARTFGAFSRHILKGMKRVEASAGSSPLLVTAYTGRGLYTLVVLNPSDHPVPFAVDWNSATFHGMERTSCYLENKQSEVSEFLIIEPGEIITLY